VVCLSQVESIFPYDPVTTERASNVRDEMAWRNISFLDASVAFGLLRLPVKVNGLEDADNADGQEGGAVGGREASVWRYQPHKDAQEERDDGKHLPEALESEVE